MRFGEAARGIRLRWLTAAAAVVFAALIAMLALGVISSLGVQGADHPVDDNGQAVDFQSQMVSDFTADNTVKIPGAVSGFRFPFVTAEDLVANQDTITVHFDKDFKGHGTTLSRDHVTGTPSGAHEIKVSGQRRVRLQDDHNSGHFLPGTGKRRGGQGCAGGPLQRCGWLELDEQLPLAD